MYNTFGWSTASWPADPPGSRRPRPSPRWRRRVSAAVAASAVSAAVAVVAAVAVAVLLSPSRRRPLRGAAWGVGSASAVADAVAVAVVASVVASVSAATAAAAAASVLVSTPPQFFPHSSVPSPAPSLVLPCAPASPPPPGAGLGAGRPLSLWGCRLLRVHRPPGGRVVAAGSSAGSPSELSPSDSSASAGLSPCPPPSRGLNSVARVRR
jgi:hypothetical protein